jgi:hypothetical protein
MATFRPEIDTFVPYTSHNLLPFDDPGNVLFARQACQNRLRVLIGKCTYDANGANLRRPPTLQRLMPRREQVVTLDYMTMLFYERYPYKSCFSPSLLPLFFHRHLC